MNITNRKFVAFPPNRTFTKIETNDLCEVCQKQPAKFLLKNSLLLCCKNYANKCSKTPRVDAICYGCGKAATLVQSCGPVCGEGKAQIKCPVAAKANHEAQVSTLTKRLEDPEFSAARLEKFETTMIEKYGAKSAVLVPELAEKIKNTNMERYGVEHGPQILGVFNAARERYKESHGVDHWTQLPLVQNKRRETSIENYGVENPIQNKEVVDLRRKNNQGKYGVGHPMQVPEIAAKWYKNWKTIQGNLDVEFGSKEWWAKYSEAYKSQHGFDHPGKDPARAKWWVENVKPTLYRTHQFTLPSGRVVNYQGYEDRAIKKLLKTFTEEEIIFAGEKTFTWFDQDNDEHTYYPDLGIKPKQTIIEVKSEYTLLRGMQDNSLVQKLLAVRMHGWYPLVQVWESEGDDPLVVLTLEDLIS